MNSIAYIIYLLITYFITVQVGLRFYRNGRIYMLGLLDGNELLTDFINKLLLIGYYLLNLGYAALMIQLWTTVTSWLAMVESVFLMTGRIMLTLALLHFMNMAVIYFIRKQQHISLHTKK